jgi:hypothetical protein
MRKIPGLFILLFVFVAAFLNSGTVRRKQTGISKAQTAGIKLKDKLEELKDGEKGPATPSFGWYGGKNGFMSDPPFSKDKPSNVAEKAVVPVVSEVELSPSGSSTAKVNDADDSEGWDEDWADDDGDEGGNKEDEALPPKDDTEEDVDRPDSPENSDTSNDKKSSKWDKDWWDEI